MTILSEALKRAGERRAKQQPDKASVRKPIKPAVRQAGIRELDYKAKHGSVPIGKSQIWDDPKVGIAAVKVVNPTIRRVAEALARTNNWRNAVYPGSLNAECVWVSKAGLTRIKTCRSSAIGILNVRGGSIEGLEL